MLDFLLSPPVVPFSLALGLLLGLLLMEIAALLAGGTLLSKGGSDADADMGAGPDAAPDFDSAPDLDAGLDAGLAAGAEVPGLPSADELAAMDTGGLDAADLGLDGAPPAAQVAGGGLAAVLGLGPVPFLVWLAAVLAGFGLSGYLLQSLSVQLFGAPLPAVLAVVPAAVLGLTFARLYGRALARLIPRTESSVRSKAMLNRKRGVVSQGTARAGQPAEVRVSDSFGNLHFIRAEPLDRREAIPPGTEVLVLRIRHGAARGTFRIVPLSDP